MNNKIYQWVVIGVIGILAIVALFKSPSLPKLPSSYFGATAAGNLLAENYIPYILYNGGYNSAKDLNITGGVTFGSSGTTFTRQNMGTCYIIPTATTIVASTTQTVDCQATAAIGSPNQTGSALAGVTSGDIVVAQLSTSTASVNGSTVVGTGFMGLTIVGASASSTSGYISLRIFNGFGGTYTWPTSAVGGVNATGTVSYFIAK